MMDVFPDSRELQQPNDIQAGTAIGRASPEW